MNLFSAAFLPGTTIPTRYTADGDNLSPPLQWQGLPAATRSLAIIADDPDAPRGTWTHWLLWDLSPELTGLAEGFTEMLRLGTSGTNDFHRRGYGGPAPPPGHGAHRYFFRLYALDTQLGVPTGAGRVELNQAMVGHVLARAELMGKYSRVASRG